jgi:hypothetical protein
MWIYDAAPNLAKLSLFFNVIMLSYESKTGMSLD